MAEDVTAGEPIVEATTSGGGVEYRFPVEVEVRSTRAEGDLQQVARLVLGMLASAVKSK